MIRKLPGKYDVSAALLELADSPHLWNEHSDRTKRYGTPHAEVDDIWVRFNPIDNRDADPRAFFQDPHRSEWYPGAALLPSVRVIVEQVFSDVGGHILGGVLITRIAPKGEVLPHIDTGWHAGYYEKFAVQLAGNEEQAFCFEGNSLSALPGELYTFDNSKLHWVKNDSDSERITLIICIRRNSDATS